MANGKDDTTQAIRYWHQQGLFLALDNGRLQVLGDPAKVERHAAAIRRNKEAVIARLQTAEQQRENLEALALASWCKPDCKHLLRTRMSSGENALWCYQYRNIRSWSRQRLCILKACPMAAEEQAAFTEEGIL